MRKDTARDGLFHWKASVQSSAAGVASRACSVLSPPPLRRCNMATLQDIARQLNDQVESNNDLLQQIGQLENQHLAFQRAVQEKQVQLRQALQVADSARAEGNELRRKLAVAQVSEHGVRCTASSTSDTTPPPLRARPSRPAGCREQGQRGGQGCESGGRRPEAPG